jgi:diguanylate cyclase (GGDEF)-like protein
MNVPEKAPVKSEPVASVYEAYAQLVKMLLPSSGCLAIYAIDGDLAWCSDGFERPDFRELVDDFKNRQQGPELNHGVIRETTANVNALIARLGDSAGKVLGYALIELGRKHSNAGRSMAASMIRPLFSCLASQLALERPQAEPAALQVPAFEDPRLEFLLGLGDLDLNRPHAIRDLLRRCVAGLDCLSAVFCIPDQDLTVIADGNTDDETRSQLDGTRKHLLAWAALNNRPMVVNRVDSVKAPYKILSCPVVDHEERNKGLIALFRGADSTNFELDDVRLIEFLARQAMALLCERQDTVSGLMSRAAFERILDEKLESKGASPKGTLLYIDVNELKQINAAFGYCAGDEAILRTAQLIRRSLTAGEIGCRLAADRFVIWLPERNRNDAEMLADELIESADALGYASEGERVPLSLRCGVAEAPNELGEARHWIAAAELACQEARTSG